IKLLLSDALLSGNSRAQRCYHSNPGRSRNIEATKHALATNLIILATAKTVSGVFRRSSRMTVALVLLALLIFASSSQTFAHGQAVVATAKDSGPSLGGIAYDPGKGEIFVSSDTSGNVTVIS